MARRVRYSRDIMGGVERERKRERKREGEGEREIGGVSAEVGGYRDRYKAC